MNFAFLIMGDFDSAADRAQIHGGLAQIVGVANLEQAKAAAVALQQSGVGCIELCGAFGPDGAREIVRATGNTIPIGYITHLPEQDDVYNAAFPGA